MEQTVRPTSSSSAECAPIVLRETRTTKLIFDPLLVRNPESVEACVKGCFRFLRKGPTGDWEDVQHLRLNSLKANEFVKLALHSAELRRLMTGVQQLYDLYQQQGIPVAPTSYLPADRRLVELFAGDTGGLFRFLDSNPEDGLDVLGRLLDWVTGIGNAEEVVARLGALDSLQTLNTFVGLHRLRQCLQIWASEATNGNEEFWQTTFEQNPFVLTQIFAHPVVVIRGKAYVGGKSVTNQGGRIVDFLCRNEITQNAILIEIKTPVTRLLGGRYRESAYPISSDLSGSIAQVMSYRHQLEQDYLTLVRTSTEGKFEAFSPACVVVAGNYASEIRDDNQKESFDLFRGQLREVQVVTYDELFERVRMLIGLFEGAIPDRCGGHAEDSTDIPF